MTALTETRPGSRLHYAWIVVAVTFLVLLVGAGVRATPSVLIVPWEREFGWTAATIGVGIAPVDGEDAAMLMQNADLALYKAKAAGRATMRRVVRDWGDELARGGVGLFYYAGHGMQIKGRNYLIPVTADVQREDEVEDLRRAGRRPRRHQPLAAGGLEDAGEVRAAAVVPDRDDELAAPGGDRQGDGEGLRLAGGAARLRGFRAVADATVSRPTASMSRRWFSSTRIFTGYCSPPSR